MNNPSKALEHLIKFALKQHMLHPLDVIPARNELIDLLQIEEPYDGELEEIAFESAVPILNKLLDYAAEKVLIQHNTTTYRDLLDAKIMGILIPKQSQVVREFAERYERNPKEATDYFYEISKASNYIRMDRIEKNLYWLAPTGYGDIEITVNLSKPEKDPKDIAASRLRPEANYPKCLLCLENVGYAGHINHPARQNHRVIPVQVGMQQWYLQFSPYVYYNEHCILFYEKHCPMKISPETFVRFLDFLEQYPHYFIGSNADLPIVGGSILSHEHYQGGRHVFPMEKAPIEAVYISDDYKDLKVGIVKWPMSVLRVSSHDRKIIEKVCCEILGAWREYSDNEAGIFAYSEVKGERVPHNTITPIARKNALGEFEVDLVLRNNRTSLEHPDGIFHPHKELHHIKKENIGLIEVMGLAVLPGRLEGELKSIARIISGDEKLYKKVKAGEEEELAKHLGWIEELKGTYITINSMKEAEALVKKAVGNKFLKVLEHCGVYKRDEEGREAFNKFFETLGFKKSL
ncbi:UDP-glucose--hexose-1-phosphate uridylyltransferase [Desnuesiella massiliensis]|uniref:UDP-glucose--hexose-1-phosphate uridylyltransferase n=1 Tax=Desnuesiella massiliensis TaxID=1650662 RepID=UPI0006E25837|nr:UDP-glucose--hexose-1-phosphate uridylyltransferase [Desnuesiella massiliensis]